MTTTTLSPSRTELQRKLLEMQLRQAREHFAVAAARLGDQARLIALMEGELAALEGQCGWHRPGPSARELAGTVALGALSPLRPYLPFVSEEAAK
jgi:hypothetical protein